MPQTAQAPRIWWEGSGHGTPVLLVMGHAFGSAMWHRAVGVLARDHRVLTFDNRGIGLSGDVRTPFGIGDMAADAVEVLDAAGVESAHVYGVSMGGLIAQELALAHPDRVRSLVLGCTGAPDGSEPRTRVGALQRLVPASLAIRLFPKAVAATLYGEAPPAEAVREDLAILARTRLPRRVLAFQRAAIEDYESASRVGSILVPTLVLHGTADRIVPSHQGRRLAELVPGASLHMLDGAGHNYLTDSADEANRVVSQFLLACDEEPARATP